MIRRGSGRPGLRKARGLARPALCQLQLKTTPPTAPGGWRCYITNVIKEADVVRDFAARRKQSLAIEWDVLRWEIEQVSPDTILTVGDSASQPLTK